MLGNKMKFVFTIFQVLLQLQVVLMSNICSPQCDQGYVCFKSKCEDFSLNPTYVRVANTADKSSYILQMRLGKEWYSVVEISGIQPPSMFCRAMNVVADKPYYLQRKTEVGEGGCVMINRILCQPLCIGEIQDLQDCSEKYRLSLICNSEYRTGALALKGHMTHASLSGDIEVLHDNLWFRICSREGSGVNFTEIIIGELCIRSRHNKFTINEVCTTGIHTAVIYKYNTYVYSIHQKQCHLVLQAKCMRDKSVPPRGLNTCKFEACQGFSKILRPKDAEKSNSLQITNLINSKVLHCNLFSTPSGASLSSTYRYSQSVNNLKEGISTNRSESKNDETYKHESSSLLVTHTSYSFVISLLALVLMFTVFKISKIKSELKKAQNFKIRQMPKVKFVKPGKISFEMMNEEIRRITSDSTVEIASPEVNKDHVIVPYDEALTEEGEDVTASTDNMSQTEDMHDYAYAEFNIFPERNPVDSKAKETRAQYDEINAYEELSQYRQNENEYLQIDKSKWKKMKS